LEQTLEVVVDASVIVKWLIEEQDSDKALTQGIDTYLGR